MVSIAGPATKPVEGAKLNGIFIETDPDNAATWLVCQFRVDGLLTDFRAIKRGFELNVSKNTTDLHNQIVAGGVFGRTSAHAAFKKWKRGTLAAGLVSFTIAPNFVAVFATESKIVVVER